MKKLHILFLLLFLGYSQNVIARCTDQDIAQMKERGFGDMEIRRICGHEDSHTNNNNLPSSNGNHQLTNICQTPEMLCMLNQKGPVGATCWCMTPYGPVAGKLIPER